MTFRGALYESFHRPRRFLCNLIDNPALILLYHRVTTLPDDPQLLAVEPENFFRQIEYLRKRYTILRVDEFVDCLLRAKRFPKNSILLTFDDGYADNALEARPILESLNAQAVFYVTTSLLGTERELWWDELERIFLLEATLPNELTLTIKGLVHTFATRTPSERRTTYHSLHPLIKYVTAPERERILDDLFRWGSLTTKGRTTHRMMTHDELRLLAGSPSAVIGAHTQTHTALVTMTYEEQRNDIMTAQTILTQITGTPPRHFSYPFGMKKDYNDETLRIVDEVGYDIVCSNYYDQVHRWSSKYELPRMLIRNWEFPFFQSSLNHFFRY